MERERITISIKDDILKKIDKTIDGINIRNRSHAIEFLASEALMDKVIKNAVVLIGGEKATKLLPSVEQILRNLSASGFEKVYVAVGFLADKVKATLGNGDKFGLELVYLEKGEGTAGAILPLKKIFNSSFIVINPEKVIDQNIDSFINFHKAHSNTATVVTDDLKELKGIYILEPEIFSFIPKGFSMLETDIFPEILRKNQLAIYPVL